MNQLPDQPFAAARLAAAGLNLHAVFNIADLPPDIAGQLVVDRACRQLILLGHGGRALWEVVKASASATPDPIDDHTRATVDRWFAEDLPGHRYQVIYPGSRSIGLQTLGKLAGWHHASPFMIGINRTWGSWFAYRAVVLADTHFAPSAVVADSSPCSECAGRACVSACPGGALDGAAFSLEKCVAWRKQPASSCRTTCLARLACPVACQHRYDDEQIRHSYVRSLQMIEQHY
ncbi:MAG: hypothetical protein ACM3X0_12065 [Bacteroidota bacterium]